MVRININHIKINDLIASSEEYRLKIQTLIVGLITSVLSLIMFVLNIITKTTNLSILTGLLSFVGICSVVLITKTDKKEISGALIGIFIYLTLFLFLLDGGIEGFSPFWLCLCPFISYFIYGKKVGFYFGVSIFFVISIVLWTPVNQILLYEYHKSFLMRFPILYFGYFLTATAFDYIRHCTFMKLKETVKKLEEISRIDELTKIENRRAFDIRLEELWMLLEKNNNYISVLMIDIDYFKRYNDNYGHLAGDTVLVQIAQIISSVMNRKRGYVSRWGGEEFIVLLPFCDLNNAIAVAEEILDNVRLNKIPHEYNGTGDGIVTVSIGVATSMRNNLGDANRLVELADKSLYRAKETGRNRVGEV